MMRHQPASSCQRAPPRPSTVELRIPSLSEPVELAVRADKRGIAD